ncbi:MAG: hypothetical protein H6739_29030 [Alphaproteobacteria bacterium]|nr:hypothetical protein [Alphaproteobacteria bacterium]
MTLTHQLLLALTLAAPGALAALRPPGPDGPSGTGRALGLGFLGVCALLVLNQLVFAVFVAAAGLPPWTAGFPKGWFLTVRGPAVAVIAAWIAEHPALLEVASWSLLRVNALLELPFAALAALCAAWIVGPGLPARLLRPAPWGALCASWTLVFIALEQHLANPWTHQDVLLRVVAAVATLGLGPALRRRCPSPSRPPRVVDARAAAEAVLALGLLSAAIVTFAYLTLVYNLAELGWLWPALLPTCAALALLVRALAAAPDRVGDPLWRGLGEAAGVFVLVFVPVSIPLRYAWPHPVAQGLLALLVGGAVLFALTRMERRLPHALGVGLGLTLAATDGFGALSGAWLAWPDLLMLARGGLFLATWIAAVAAWSAVRPGDP